MSLEKQIQIELTKLDKDLFLDKERSGLNGAIYFVVKYNIGSGQDPLIAKVWGDAEKPWPLSMSIVDAVKAQEGDIREAIKEITVNNAVLKERRRQEYLEKLEESAKEHQKAGKIKRYFGDFRKV